MAMYSLSVRVNTSTIDALAQVLCVDPDLCTTRCMLLLATVLDSPAHQAAGIRFQHRRDIIAPVAPQQQKSNNIPTFLTVMSG